MASKLISVQVGTPRKVPRGDSEVLTGIFKSPVKARVQMRALNLDGDAQADLTVHGGRDKAVYAYPAEHYEYWRRELPGVDLPWGAFGENLTTEGLLEPDVHIGDRFVIGGAEVVVTQPRLPCFKLNLKFQSGDMGKRFLASGRTGFYLRVLREGEIGAGDAIVRVHEDENRVSISEVLQVYLGADGWREVRERALKVPYLSAAWREDFEQLAGK